MLNPAFHQKFYEQFETSDLLDAVGHVDILSRELSDGANLRPPAIRKELLRLHQLAMDVSHRGNLTQAQEMCDLAFAIEDQLFTIWESFKAVEETIQGITNLANEFDDGYGEEE